MVNKDIYSPIIIIGMHRSGTTMITKMLEELGLFVGSKKDENNESVFFSELNDWLFKQCGGSWDNPESFYYLLENQNVKDLAIDYIKYILNSHWFISYLGINNYIRYKNPHNITIPWGWKDPRNTFWLPIWLEIFPNAKIIHIYRHGVDVANSLKVRAEKQLYESTQRHLRRKRFYLYSLSKKKGLFVPSINAIDLEENMKLWDKYIEQSFTYNFSNENILHIKYEDFLSQPIVKLQNVVDFCHLKVDSVKIAQSVAHIRKGRAYAFNGNLQLEQLAETFEKSLNKFGY